MKLSLPAAVAACTALVLITSGCAGSATSDSLRLVQTKSQTQLLRNEAAQRLIDGTDESVAEQQDYSAACKSGSEDPNGLYRAWHSTLLAVVPADSAIGVDQFVGALATSFSEDGWTFTESHGEVKVTTMTRSDSFVILTFSSTESAGEGATVLIEATGPCVLTQGPESDEVTKLEES
jgi:hypothetical protein